MSTLIKFTSPWSGGMVPDQTKLSALIILGWMNPGCAFEIVCHYNIQNQTDYEHPHQVYFSVVWRVGTRPNQIVSLDNLWMHEPWMYILYSNKLNLMKQPGWEWIP